jgi:Trp operon repressor
MMFNPSRPALSPDTQRALAASLLQGAADQEAVEEKLAVAVAKINEGIKTLKTLNVIR